MVILDADLEYDPQDIPRLLEPVLDGRAEVVYGSRTFGSHSAYSFWYVHGQQGRHHRRQHDLQLVHLRPGDVLQADAARAVPRRSKIRSAGFGMEAEVTGKLLRRRIRPYEVPISYRARSREEGKKITWKDGVEALWILTRERRRSPEPTGSGRH